MSKSTDDQLMFIFPRFNADGAIEYFEFGHTTDPARQDTPYGAAVQSQLHKACESLLELYGASEATEADQPVVSKHKEVSVEDILPRRDHKGDTL